MALREPLDLLDIAEVAATLRLPIGSVRSLIRRGALSAITLPAGHVRIESAELVSFVERCRS